MYTVNGLELDNVTYGWVTMRGTQALSGVTRALSTVQVPGRKGVIPNVPTFDGAVTIPLVIRTPGTALEALYNLFRLNGGVGTLQLTADTTRQATFELAGIDSTGLIYNDELIDVAVTLRIPTADWRATSITTEGPTTPTTPVFELAVFSGITSDIYDADIFIDGDFGNFELVDEGSGSWVKTVKTLTYVSGHGILFVGSTGQAFTAATSAPWTPIADVSDYVDVSGGGGFRVTPTWSIDPSATIAKLQLTTTNQSGVTFNARAYNSYVLRNGGV